MSTFAIYMTAIITLVLTVVGAAVVIELKGK